MINKKEEIKITYIQSQKTFKITKTAFYID